MSWALREYLSFNFTVGKQTVFKDIWTFEPGFWAQWKDGNITLHLYWAHQYSSKKVTFNKAQEDFEQIFEGSVKLHLVSDVPVGCSSVGDWILLPTLW